MRLNVMVKVIWELPFPSSAVEGGVIFRELIRRACALECEFEDDEGALIFFTLTFDGVEAYKCTYKACSFNMVSDAYDQVVDLEQTDWLNHIKTQLTVNSDSRSIDDLKHLMIYFDDGPCYEFICRTFKVDSERR